MLVLLVACGEEPEPPIKWNASVLEYRQGDLLYTYHLPTRTEALYDVAKDPKCLNNVIDERPEEARRLRLSLEGELDVKHLEEALRGLGYI